MIISMFYHIRHRLDAKTLFLCFVDAVSLASGDPWLLQRLEQGAFQPGLGLILATF